MESYGIANKHFWTFWALSQCSFQSKAMMTLFLYEMLTLGTPHYTSSSRKKYPHLWYLQITNGDKIAISDTWDRPKKLNGAATYPLTHQWRNMLESCLAWYHWILPILKPGYEVKKGVSYIYPIPFAGLANFTFWTSSSRISKLTHNLESNSEMIAFWN